MDTACLRLDAVTKDEVARVQTRRFSALRTIDLLFSPDTIAKSRAVQDIVKPSSTLVVYDMLIPTAGLVVDFCKAPGIVAVQPGATEPQPEFEQLMACYYEVREVWTKYARVKHLLRWFNRNATAGAIRNYWPSAMQLCPNSPAWEGMRDAAPDRYSTPAGIGTMLPLIRETAGTVATMALAGDRSPNSDIGVRLRMDARSDTWEGIEIDCNQLVFNL